MDRGIDDCVDLASAGHVVAGLDSGCLPWGDVVLNAARCALDGGVGG